MDLRPIQITLLILSISVSGCATAKLKAADSDQFTGKTFTDIYEKSKQAPPIDILHNPGAALQMGAQMGYTKPYRPFFKSLRSSRFGFRRTNPKMIKTC